MIEEQFMWDLATNVALLVIGGFLSWVREVFKRDRGKFDGRWEAKICWESQWSDRLIGRKATQLISTGDVCLSYGAGMGGTEYWGLSYWKLKDGPDTLYSELCVEMRDIILTRKPFTVRRPWIMSHRMKKLSLHSRFRKKHELFLEAITKGEAEYLEFAQYRIEFEVSRRNRLEGSIVVSEEGATARVGGFEATRVHG